MSQEPSRPSSPPLPGDAPRAGAAAPSRPSDEAPASSRPSSGPAPSSAGRLPAILGQVVVSSAVGIAVVVGSAWLALLSGLATLFGLGLVVALALIALGAVLVVRGRSARGWLVVPLLALAIPAVAVAASGVHVERQRGVVVHAPRTAQELPAGGYRTGLGAQLVDLRHTALPAGRTVELSARSDLDRTVVALPRDRCWNIDVRWHTGWLWLPGVDEDRWVDGLAGGDDAVARWAARGRDYYPDVEQGRIALFGRVREASVGSWTSTVKDPAAPTLRIDLRSEGGSFVVRDFPDDISPLITPDWPLAVQGPASPAELRAAWSSPRRSKAAARAWKRYRPQRAAFERRAVGLMDGGCERTVVER